MKTFIQNRKGQKLSVVVELSNNQKGLAFVMHGLSGNKEQIHIRTFIEAWKDKGYTVVSFDTTNTFGESDGNYEDATITNYYEDLEDVISWASKQDFYQEPFCLEGHSLGGICTALFTQNFPNKVRALAPISTLVSGKLSVETKTKEYLDSWKERGIQETKGYSGEIKRLKWSHMEDRLKYDLLEKVDKLTMPVLLIVGEEDITTPLKHQKILYDKLPGEKELHVIKGAPHTFREPEHLREIREIISHWIEKLS